MPDAPINLENVAYLTDFDTAAMIWDQGLEDGGSAVLSYRVWWNQGSGDSFEPLE